MPNITASLGMQGPAGPSTPPCRLATNAVLPTYTAGSTGLIATLNGALTVDSVAVVTGDTVLVKNEGSGSSVNNLIYTVLAAGSSSTPWQLAFRSIVYLPGYAVTIGLGTVNARKIYLVTTDINQGAPFIRGTTALTWQTNL